VLAVTANSIPVWKVACSDVFELLPLGRYKIMKRILVGFSLLLLVLTLASFIVGQAQKAASVPERAQAGPMAQAPILDQGARLNPLKIGLLHWYLADTTTSVTVGSQLLNTVTVGANPGWMAFDGANLWVPYGTNTVAKIQASTGAITGSFTVGVSPIATACDGVNIWVVNGGGNGAGSVTKLRARDGKVMGTFSVGVSPIGVAFDGASIWVANYGDGTVSKLRASDGTPLGTFNTPGSPYGLAFDGANVWVTGSPYVYELRASDGIQIGFFVPHTNTVGVAFDGANVWIAQQNANALGKM
jgi:hypothetical protein